MSAAAGDDLPVLFVSQSQSNIGAMYDTGAVQWIYGGAFETGNSASNPGNAIVERSLVLNEPIIFVSINYRLNGRYSDGICYHVDW